jgi:hypothetical protein
MIARVGLEVGACPGLAPEIGGFASVVLIVAAPHNSWEMTLIIISRPG